MSLQPIAPLKPGHKTCYDSKYIVKPTNPAFSPPSTTRVLRLPEGRALGVLWEGRAEDPVGARHPLRDDHASGVRNPPEGGGTTEGTGSGGKSQSVRKYGDRRGSRGHRLVGNEPDGYDQDQNDDRARALRWTDGRGVGGTEQGGAPGGTQVAPLVCEGRRFQDLP